MRAFNLPADAVEFLRAGRQLEYDYSRIEAGHVKLKRLDKLSQGEVWIGTDITGDPHAGEEGYYAIPAIADSPFANPNTLIGPFLERDPIR